MESTSGTALGEASFKADHGLTTRQFPTGTHHLA